MSRARTRLVLALVSGGLTLAYLLPYRAYGLNVEDEGTLLYQILRVTRWELPYVDFSTGYTPAFFFLNAQLWRMAGDLPTLRAVLAVIHALSVAGLTLIVARVARPTFAVLVPLLYLVFIPVFPGEFCAFNVPYPAWFATLGWVATAWAMLGFVNKPHRGWLVLAGIMSAATLGMKPNAGVFAIAAATAVVLSREGPEGGTAAAALWVALWSGVLGGVVAALGLRPAVGDLLAYLAPLVLAMAALVTRSRVRRAALAGDAVALLLPFLALSLPWLAFFFRRLGPAGFAREVLLIGSGAADLYYLPYPAPGGWAVVVAALTLGLGAVGAWARSGQLAPRWAAACAGTALLGVAFAVSLLGLMPEGVTWSLIWQFERAGFPLALLTNAVGALWLWRSRKTRESRIPTVLLLFGLFMHLQLYPRADFTHLVIAVPLASAFAAYLLERVLRWWEIGLASAGAVRESRAVGPVVCVGLLAVLGLRASPGVVALAHGERDVLPFAHAAVGVERGHAADLRSLGAAAARLAHLVRPGEPSIGFPALAAVLFLADARNPAAHDYFYAGRPDHREEAEILDALAATPPAALASVNRHFTFFDAAPSYYFLLRRFVQARYEPLERHGRYDVLGPRGSSQPPQADRPPAEADSRSTADRLAALRETTDVERRLASLAALAADPPSQTAPALLDAATSPEAVVRAAALDSLLSAIEREPARGLESYVAISFLDRRRQVLLLRTIRDVRDARAASYLFHAAASNDARLSTEAFGAMYCIRAELIARQHLWTGAETPRSWPGQQVLVEAVRSTLADTHAPSRATAFAAHLAGALRDPESIAPLRARLAPAVASATGRALNATGEAFDAPFDGATTASVAAALVELAPEGLACELTALLSRREAPILDLVPTLLLRLAEGAEPARSEARQCLLQAVEQPDAARTQAIWVAAALADPSFEVRLRAALGAAPSEVRQAAAWALGEIAGSAAGTAELMRVATDDPDEITRRLAANAAEKRRGAFPRRPTPR